MKRVEEIGETNDELKVKSSEKGQTEIEYQQDIQKVEITKGKQQQVGKPQYKRRSIALAKI